MQKGYSSSRSPEPLLRSNTSQPSCELSIYVDPPIADSRCIGLGASVVIPRVQLQRLVGRVGYIEGCRKVVPILREVTLAPILSATVGSIRRTMPVWKFHIAAALVRGSNDGVGNQEKQEIGRWANNRVENSHLPFRRRERVMQRFRRKKTLQKLASVHARMHHHFNSERHLVDRQTYKLRRSAAVAEWQSLIA